MDSVFVVSVASDIGVPVCCQVHYPEASRAIQKQRALFKRRTMIIPEISMWA